MRHWWPAAMRLLIILASALGAGAWVVLCILGHLLRLLFFGMLWGGFKVDAFMFEAGIIYSRLFRVCWVCDRQRPNENARAAVYRLCNEGRGKGYICPACSTLALMDTIAELDGLPT